LASLTSTSTGIPRNFVNVIDFLIFGVLKSFSFPVLNFCILIVFLSNHYSLPSLLMQAARSAAEADGVAPPPEDDGMGNGDKSLDLISSAGASALEKARAAIAAAQGGAPETSGRKSTSAGMSGAGGGGGKKKGPPLRRGKWTAEEEAYANRLIQEFKAGLLPLTDGTTLRTFLSKLLNCDPMRISKKFVGNNCIGKQVFRRRTADLNRLTPEQIQQSRAELSE
jgi:hypothetical protein